MEYSLISHQTGAVFATLFDQMIEFKPVWKLRIAIHAAKEHAPTFQDWNIFFDIDRRTSKHAVRFAMGTRKREGSMTGSNT